MGRGIGVYLYKPYGGRTSQQYCQGDGETNTRDIAGYKFDSLDDVGMLQVANLLLEQEMDAMLFIDDGGCDIYIYNIFSVYPAVSVF